MGKRVMLIDDEAGIRLSVDNWRARLDDTEFFIGASLYDADCYVYDDGIEFDAMVIDFSYTTGESYSFEDEIDLQEYHALGESADRLLGWIWIKRFLRKHPKYKARRIIGLSAFTDLLKKQEVLKAGIWIIDKRDNNSVERILSLIERL